jgi:hypothetical protein
MSLGASGDATAGDWLCYASLGGIPVDKYLEQRGGDGEEPLRPAGQIVWSCRDSGFGFEITAGCRFIAFVFAISTRFSRPA